MVSSKDSSGTDNKVRDEFPSLAIPSSCSPSYTAWSGSTGRERCASIFVAPHSEHTSAEQRSGGANCGENESDPLCNNGTGFDRS